MKNPCLRLALLPLLAVPLAADEAAGLTPYSEDFEDYEEVGEERLLGNDWQVFGNAYNAAGGYEYGYGVFPAPNNGGGFCNIATGEGGPDQGDKVLTVYADYNNGEMAAPPDGPGHVVEANVFREYVVGPGDVGTTWTFAFDVKLGNLEAPSTAKAFIKVLDPNNGYSLTEFVTFDTDQLGDTLWTGGALEITIGDWTGQLLQTGFLASATDYQGSGAFYDNLSFTSPGYVAPAGPKVVSVERNAFGEVIVSFETRSGYEYRFEKASTPAGPYEEIDFGVLGDGSVQAFIDFDASGPSGFYRVDEQPIP